MNRKSISFILALLLLLILVWFLIVALRPATTPRYHITDLGTLGGFSEAIGLNNNSEVVGVSEITPGVQHGFLWKEGSMRDLGTLGGATSSASAINDRGLIVGTSAVAGGTDYAVLWDPETGIAALDLGEVDESRALHLNNKGEVIGQYQQMGRGFQGFVWSATTGLIELSDSSTSGTHLLYSINDQSQVAGMISVASGKSWEFHGYLWESENGMTDLGTLSGYSNTVARHVNEEGQIVGYSKNEDRSGFGDHTLFLWDGGQLQNLETSDRFLCYDASIDSHGRIVGTAFPISWGGKPNNISRWTRFFRDLIAQRAKRTQTFLWEKGNLHNLKDLVIDATAWKALLTANDVNSKGQIVGRGILKTGAEHAFLLTPVENTNEKAE